MLFYTVKLQKCFVDYETSPDFSSVQRRSVFSCRGPVISVSFLGFSGVFWHLLPPHLSSISSFPSPVHRHLHLIPSLVHLSCFWVKLPPLICCLLSSPWHWGKTFLFRKPWIHFFSPAVYVQKINFHRKRYCLYFFFFIHKAKQHEHIFCGYFFVSARKQWHARIIRCYSVRTMSKNQNPITVISFLLFSFQDPVPPPRCCFNSFTVWQSISIIYIRIAIRQRWAEPEHI